VTHSGATRQEQIRECLRYVNERAGYLAKKEDLAGVVLEWYTKAVGSTKITRGELLAGMAQLPYWRQGPSDMADLLFALEAAMEERRAPGTP
jgi:hypothetical protein